MEIGSDIKRALFVALLVCVAFLMLFEFAGFLNIFPDNKAAGEQRIGEVTSDIVGLPSILVGSSDGAIYLVEKGSEPEHLGNVENDIQDIESNKNSIYVATIKDNTVSEESGQVRGKIIKISRGKDGIPVLNSLESRNVKKNVVGGQLLDIEVVGDNLILASHDHDSKIDITSEKFYKGRLTILDSESLKLKEEINLVGASGIKTYNDTILAYGVGPEALLLEKDNLTVTKEIGIDGSISGGATNKGTIYLSSARDRKLDGIPNPPTVTHGFVSKHNKSGEELVKLDLGITSRPREIYAYANDSVMVNDYAEKKVKFIDFSEKKVTESIKLSDRPEDLVRSGDTAYVIGANEHFLYVVDVEEKDLERKVKVPKISSISSY